MTLTRLGLAATLVGWLGLGVAFLLGSWGMALGAFGVLAGLASTRRSFQPPPTSLRRRVQGPSRQGSVLVLRVEAEAPTGGLLEVEAPLPLGFTLLREVRQFTRGRAVLEQEVQAIALGEVVWPDVTLRASDVWGIWSQAVTRPCPAPLAILPDARWALHGRRLGQRHPVRTTMKSFSASERSLEIENVRPYGAGDTLREIDWKASARFQGLFVRQRERHVPRPVTIVLDCRQPMRVQRQDSKLLSACRVAYGALAAASGAGTTSRLVRVDETSSRARVVTGLGDAETAVAAVLFDVPPIEAGEATVQELDAGGVVKAVADSPGLQVLLLDGEADPAGAIRLMGLLRHRGPLVVVLPASGAHLYRRGEARGPVLAALRRWRRARDQVRAAAGTLAVPVLVLRPGSEEQVLAHLGRMLG